MFVLLGRPTGINLPLFFVAPIVVWAAFRLGQRTVFSAIAAVSGMVIAATAVARGPFAEHDLNRSLLELQLFVAAFAIMTVILNAVIRERRRAEEELRRYHENLEDLVALRTRELEESRERNALSQRLASLGTPAAGVAHQINNPLGAILNGAELALICEGESDSQALWKRKLDDHVQQAKRCKRIIRSLLQFSRGERADRWGSDVNEVVERACQLTHTYAAENNATIQCKPSGRSLPVWMSPIEIEQVLVNVIRNAVESHPSGARIEVRSLRRESCVRVEVEDDGRGIQPDALAHVFDLFHTTRLAEGGTGLGLSVAHGIVTDHGGTIEVESEPGSGSTAAVELPLDERAESD